MDETLRALSELVLEAAPTLIIVLLLHFYLKHVYFRPMERVLAARYEATEGARKQAEESMARAGQRAAEYEEKLRAARADIYRDQEALRQRLHEDHAEAVKEARQHASAAITEGNREIEAELAAAQEVLAREAGALAERITDTILHRRPA
jgi:F-type H+-transporting ATPase subunit b